MLPRILLFIFTLYSLSACSSSPRDYLKTSANNKLFDRKGFQGSKRAPLYNKKYIDKAKRNAAQGDYDDDFDDIDEDEMIHENTYKKNARMYRDIVEQEKQKKRKKSGWSKSRRKIYPEQIDAEETKTQGNYSNQLELKDELEQIKVMLKETRSELENSKCPNSTAIEKENAKDPHKALPDNSQQTQSL